MRLSFGHGVFLDNPKSLPEGDQLYMGFLEISSFEDASWEDIEMLIEASARFDCTKLDLLWFSREV